MQPDAEKTAGRCRGGGWPSPLRRQVVHIVLRSLPPLHGELAAGCRTIPQIEADKRLIGYTSVRGKFFEILDGFFIEPDRDLLLIENI